MQTFKSYFKTNYKNILEDYFTLLKFKSISADPESNCHTLACADYIKSKLNDLGFKTELWPTPTQPTLFAENMSAGKDKPTVLIYNHYDVQPVDPIELWDNPPFEPTLKDGIVYARGAQDNKGQLFYVLEALKALIQLTGSLPVNVKLCIEGDEEMGSAGLHAIINQKQKELSADYLLIADLGIKKFDEPAITLGTRGLVTMEIKLQGSSTDLHSGEHGGIALNPIHSLVDLLSKVRDSSGKILIPGFYDDVVELTAEETKKIDFSFDPTAYEKSFGAHAFGGEENFSPYESAWVRPTLEINGISGGYSGPGFKTVIPAIATAKISARLVANQDPEKIRILIAEFLNQMKPKGMHLHIDFLGAKNAAVKTKPDAAITQIVAKAYSEVFGLPCKFIMTGGTIGIAGDLAKVSGAETVFLGLGLPDDQIHAPNEHFSLDRIEKGLCIIARTLQCLK